jgi:hypothetical protein
MLKIVLFEVLLVTLMKMNGDGHEFRSRCVEVNDADDTDHRQSGGA